MAAGSILLGLALLIVLGLFLARPILTAQPPSKTFLVRRQQLEEEKEVYLNEIRALDFDHDTGKVPTEVYEQQRVQLLSEAAVILKELDQLPAVDGDVSSQIEAAVAERRRQHTLSQNGQAGFCTQCGQPFDAGDRFCARCGQPLQVAQPIS